MRIVEGIVKQSIVVGVDKPKRAIAIKAVLEKLSYRVLTTTSVHELIRLSTQEMPHLVICEAVLSDGTAAVLHDKLKTDSRFSRTPILALVLKKTKQELEVLQGRTFAGFLLGDLQAPSFLAKVKQILAASNQLSPYFVKATDIGIDPNFNVFVESRALCRANDHIVFRSKLEFDSSSALTGANVDRKKPPVILNMASNVKMGDEVLNYFPVSRLQGEGRRWLMEVPEIAARPGMARKAPRKVLFYDPDQQRAAEYQQVLAGYDIALEHVQDLKQALGALGRDASLFGAVYLHELNADANGQLWKQALERIPAAKLPPVISPQSFPVRSAVAGMRRRFGIGMLVELLEGCFERGEQFVGKDLKSLGINLPVHFEAPATLLGLDEVGGLIEIKFPVTVGSKLDLPHEFLKRVWQNVTQVTVLAAVALKDSPDTWQVYFEAVPAGTSKAKYWEKVSKQLDYSKKNAAA